MTGALAADTSVDRLLDHVAAGRLVAAHRVVDGAMDDGWSVARIVTDLLAPVQRRIGNRWQAGTLTVAAEHTATAVVDDLLGALTQFVPATAPSGTIALVSAEGEWHVTPARMAALLLRHEGWRVTFFGGSTPVAHLEQTLEMSGPDFVAISCTDPRFLLGAGRVAAIGRRLAIPTVAGGAAFGSNGGRARNLGIDGWAPDAPAASRLLRGWLDVPPDARPPVGVTTLGAAWTRHRWTGVTEQVIQRLASTIPTVLHHGAQPVDDVRRDIGDLLTMARTATVCRDPSLFTGFVAWLGSVQPPRGLPHEAIGPAVRILRELVEHLDDGGGMRTILATPLVGLEPGSGLTRT